MKLLPFLFFFAACGATNQGQSGNDTISVKLNESFEIKAGVAMGTGFRWVLPDSGYLQFLRLDTTYTTSTQDVDGNPETQVFRFTGIKKGNTPLRLIHIRPWKKEDPPDKQKNYTITIL